MPMDLDPESIRVLGSLVEKSLATPDNYPLTLAALIAACNQKTSREPVTALHEQAVRDALAGLIADGMARERDGGRTSRYSHRLGDSLGLRFGFDRGELAVLGVLMLRGPQTPGELRSRTERMAGDEAPLDTDAVLERLRAHQHGPWVAVLPREAGRRESRWIHLFGPFDESVTAPSPLPVAIGSAANVPDALFDRLDELTSRVAELEDRLARLDPKSDPDSGCADDEGGNT